MAPPLTPRERVKIPPKDRTPYQNYTLTRWGETPYPGLAAPTHQQAVEVHGRLMSAHGDRLRPAHITAPSLDIAGCGEVPQVLDAIVRTMISANTTFEAADAALQKLRRAAGIISEKQELDDVDRPKLDQCLDYMFILKEMTQEQLAEAIKPAGSQIKTAGYILAILKDLLAVNTERTAAFREEFSDGGKPADPEKVMAADILSVEEKQWEIRMFEKGILNLEFLKRVPPEAAMDKMVGWKGVGVKTAACILLFCMQQDILACDTHCVRLSKWLGWAPIEATDNLVFAHVDNRVPNNLKYSLHQLFIQHGKDCLRCQEKTSENTEGWADAVCPLDDLIDRVAMADHKAEKKLRAVEKKAKKEKKEEDEVAEFEGDCHETGDETENEPEDSAGGNVTASLQRKAKFEPVAKGKAIAQATPDAEATPTAKAISAAKKKPTAKTKAPTKAKPYSKSKAKSTTTQPKIGNITQALGKVKKANVQVSSAIDKASPQVQNAAAAIFNGPITRKRIREFLDIGIEKDIYEAPPAKKLKQQAAHAAAPIKRTRAKAKGKK